MDGEKTVSFAEFRAKLRGAAFVRDEERYCKHLHLIIDTKHGTIECEECGKSVSAFVTLVKYVDQWHAIQAWKDKIDADGKAAHKEAQRRLALTYQTLKAWKPHLRAIKAFEKMWRRHEGPLCPHCNHALLAEDFADGVASVYSERYELALRAKHLQSKQSI